MAVFSGCSASARWKNLMAASTSMRSIKSCACSSRAGTLLFAVAMSRGVLAVNAHCRGVCGQHTIPISISLDQSRAAMPHKYFGGLHAVVLRSLEEDITLRPPRALLHTLPLCARQVLRAALRDARRSTHGRNGVAGFAALPLARTARAHCGGHGDHDDAGGRGAAPAPRRL